MGLALERPLVTLLGQAGLLLVQLPRVQAKRWGAQQFGFGSFRWITLLFKNVGQAVLKWSVSDPGTSWPEANLPEFREGAFLSFLPALARRS